MLGFESVSLLEDFGDGVAPTFTIVSSKKYIRDINSANSSTVRNSTLPPSFIISLSYKPQNNTVLKLLSSYTVRTVTQSKINIHQPIGQNSPLINTPESDSQFSNSLSESDGNSDGSAVDLLPSNTLEPELESGSGELTTSANDNDQDDSLASLLLSSTATYLQENSFLDLWTNISGSTQHNLVFMVVNGTISSCLNGELKVGEENLGLWNANTTFDEKSEGEEKEDEEEKETIQVKFSDALHAVQSVVSLNGVSTDMWVAILTLGWVTVDTVVISD